MRKILAGFMATAMVTSICATASFAAAATNAYVSEVSAISSGLGDQYAKLRLTINPNAVAGDVDDIIIEKDISYTDTTNIADDLAKSLNGTKFDDVLIGGKVYNLTLKRSGTNAYTLQFSPAVAVTGLTTTSEIGLEIYRSSTSTWHDIWALGPISGYTGKSLGTGTETADKETSGTFTKDNVKASEVLVAYGDGTPIPLTENAVGVDKDLNDKGGVQSNQTVYFMVRNDVVPKLDDSDYWKLKITKGENGKYIDVVSDVTKIFSGNLYDANTGAPVEGTGNNIRRRYIKVALNEIYTDDEYKIGLDMRLSATSKAVNTNIATDDSEIKVKDFTFYMKNIVKAADNDWKVGINGLMLNPLTNDWNTVTYYDEDGDVASLKFFADSDTGKFYSKLSTKWAHEDYAAYFNDQDAFYFEFTGSPKLSSTSRADLQIYNPFMDEDGNETIDPTTATIYQVVDGDLIDVTDSFTYGEGENGDNAFITRTRFLGSYIICEKPVEEAAGESDIEDLLPGENETPDDVTPDAGNNGGKAPANTGRYL